MIKSIAFIGNYLPRKCGIATFTSDLLTSVATNFPKNRCFAIPINDVADGYKYPDLVHFEIDEQDILAYHRAADFLNISNVDVVSVQHEFGIFGGPAGSHLLYLLRRLAAPVVTTLHTVLSKPSLEQLRVMQELLTLSTRVVVMTERGKSILREVYRTPTSKIDVIPHGIPDVALEPSQPYKEKFGFAGKNVILTFGLLSPNKGIEHVINALPKIVKEVPNTLYVLLGATHPHEVAAHGEIYRWGLETLAKTNGVDQNILFVDRFVDLEELVQYIAAADIYVTPYLDENQSTSGTLSYAFGAGKPVISTPYWHATELLQNGRGILVPFANPKAIARGALDLLTNEEKRKAMSEAAYATGREMIWSKTAAQYMISFEQAYTKERSTNGSALNLDHLYKMSDSVGIFQHANLSTPNLQEGYCTDDNARALILAVLLSQLEENQERSRALATTYVTFLQNAFMPEASRFHNFLNINREWLDICGSEDSHGRAVWALGTAIGREPRWSSQPIAEELFVKALPTVLNFNAPRAWAFVLIGINEYLNRFEDATAVGIRKVLVDRLVDLFDKVAVPGWIWFEESLTYDNAKLAHALIVNGRSMDDRVVFEKGIQALRWLVEVQTTQHGQLRPIGNNGFYVHNGSRAIFDQQPIEAQSTVSACLSAYRITGDPWWYEQAECAFSWFLGNNDLDIALYDYQTGGCNDGLHPDRSNKNQGAESTLSFLLSLVEMKLETRS